MGKKLILKSYNQISKLRESGKHLTTLLNMVREKTAPWVSLIELEEIAENYMKKYNLKWAFKGYMWFPANLCLSVNDCLVHWIPDDYVLKQGDLLKVDCWVNYDGLITDSAFSVEVWVDGNSVWNQLINSTKKALDNSLELVHPDNYIYDYSLNIYKSMINDGFSVIKNLTWHWVWLSVHEQPHIYNVPHPEAKKTRFQQNMVLALEPITALESDNVKTKPWNNWNLYTELWDIGAQREYTVVVNEKWVEILSGLTD